MATTRLRKTFHYPSDTDDEETLEDGMDAQGPPPHPPPKTPLTPQTDQATLLSDLRTHDTTTTRLYTHLLLIFPLAPALLYLARLFTASTFLASAAALASLLASAYTLYYLPLDATTSPARTPAPTPPLPPHVASLASQYLVRANAGVCVVLALHEVAQRRAWSEGMVVGGGYVPGVVLGVILWARRELRAVDMVELERARVVREGL
jgi:hypothetical protein